MLRVHAKYCLRGIGLRLLALMSAAGCQSLARTPPAGLAEATQNPLTVRVHTPESGSDPTGPALAGPVRQKSPEGPSAGRSQVADASGASAATPRVAMRPAGEGDEPAPEHGIARASAERPVDEPVLRDVFLAQEVDGGAATAPVAPQPVGPVAGAGGLVLSLPSAIGVSLMQNPDLIAARGQDQVGAAVVEVAGTYPWNPFVQAQYLPGTDGANATQSNYYVWLMQRFELAHQRHYREQNANWLLNQVRWNIHQAELLNVAQTVRLYFTALYQFEINALAQETAQLNDDLLGVVERRYQAGLAQAAQVTTAQVAARQSRRQALLAEANYQTALLALRQQLNLSADTPLVFTHRLGDIRWEPADRMCRCGDQTEAAGGGSVRLATELINGRPDVLAALSGVSAARANFDLANAARIPDLQAGPILNAYPNGAHTLGFRLQMDLPVLNTGAPLARQRAAECQQQARVYQQLRARAIVEAETALDRYERARELAAQSAVDLTPFADKMPAELKAINEQFQAGQADILAVFATQNSLLQDRRTYLDLLNELAQSAAGVVQATALPVERVITLDDGTSRL